MMLLPLLTAIALLTPASPSTPNSTELQATLLIQGESQLDREALITALPPELKAKRTDSGLDLGPWGEWQITLTPGPLPDADPAWRRGITPLLSDQEAPTGDTRLTLSTTAAASEPTLHRLVELSGIACQLTSCAGVYFSTGAVLHPASYVHSIRRDRLPSALLWVGLDLERQDGQFLISSRGLQDIGRRELTLVTAPKDISGALQASLDLIGYLSQQPADPADDSLFERQDDRPPLRVKVIHNRTHIAYAH